MSRQRKRERRAFADFAACLNPAAVALHDARDDREADAYALEFPRV
jgi:hypothetical protein